MSDLLGLHLIEPRWLLLSLAVVAALVVRRRRGHPALVFAPLDLVEDGGPSIRRSLVSEWPALLRALAILLAVVALARPAVVEELPLEIEGIDVLLCLDVSSSMSARDLDAERTRLDVARDAAAEFIAGRAHDRIGLVSFARYPDLLCPPTLDHGALGKLLDAVELVEHQGPEDATAIGAAVAESAGVLKASDARSRVVVLLTDGAENVATAETPHEIAPLHAAQLCRDLGVRVYAIAAGADGATSSEWEVVDTAEIEALAEKTGGRFFTAGDAESLADVYRAIDELERTTFAAPRYETEDRFLIFILLAAALHVAARVAEAHRRGVMP